jgi:hypothetical protein
MRAAILPAALLAASFAAAQAPPAAEPQPDPYTAGDPKLLAAAGYVSFAPFVWADDHGTADIERTIGGNKLRWVETTHFRIGSMLGDWKLPNDRKLLKKLGAEVDALRAKLPKVPARPKELDAWLRLHLLAQRCETLYAEFSARLGVTDADFPATPPAELPLDYRGEGPYLGQRGKFLVLIVDKPGALARYMGKFAGIADSRGDCQRFNFMRSDSLFTGACIEQSDGSKLDDSQLHNLLVFNLVHNLIDGYEHYWYRLPAWWCEGLAHWHARRAYDGYGSFSGMSAEDASRVHDWNWPPKVRARVRHGAFTKGAELLQWMDPAKLSFADHMASWSRVDFLLSRGDESFAKYMRMIKGRIPMTGAVPTEAEILAQQQQALQQCYGFDAAGLDAAWAKWVLDTYPQR